MSIKLKYRYQGPIWINGVLNQEGANGQGLAPIIYEVYGSYFYKPTVKEPHRHALNGLKMQIVKQRSAKGLSGYITLQEKYLIPYYDIPFIAILWGEEHTVYLPYSEVCDLIKHTERGKEIIKIKDLDEFASQAEYYLTNSDLYPTLADALASKRLTDLREEVKQNEN